jgi:sulfite reductase (ferredoxin)
MESFRTEIEDPIVQKDIIDLERKIALFRDGKIDDERFRSLRLARGVWAASGRRTNDSYQIAFW